MLEKTDTNYMDQVKSIKLPLRDYIRLMMDVYYRQITENGDTPSFVYQLLMEEVELAMIEATMKHCKNNQSTAAKALGLNRGTFRKKLIYYGII